LNIWEPHLLELEAKVSSARWNRAALLLYTSLGTQGILLDACRLFGVRHAVMWWVVFRNHKHPAEDGTRVVRGDVDSNLLEFVVFLRQGSLCSAGEALLVDPFPQMTSTEGMPRTLVVGARYVEWIMADVRFRFEVARVLPLRLNLGDLGHLASVDVGRRSETKGEGPVAWRRSRRVLGSLADLKGVLHHANDTLHP
jgi:hypothetical protein